MLIAYRRSERRSTMNMNNDFDREISFDIVEQLGVITSYSTGWCKELNLVSWNGGTPKYDIRDWAPDHEHMSRGVTLHEKEMRTVIELLRRRNRRKPAGYGRSAGLRNRDGQDDIRELAELHEEQEAAQPHGAQESECEAFEACDCQEEQTCVEESA